MKNLRKSGLRAPLLSRILSHVPFYRSAVAARSREYWRSIRGIHSGRRGFVIGNGPSLAMDDLSGLREEVTIASNRIYMAFGMTRWRPTYYTVSDPLVWIKVRGDLPGKVGLVHIPSYLPVELSRIRTQIWKTLSFDKYVGDSVPFSSDLSIGAYGGGTVTYENLQLAVHLGLNPIYIIGCDHSYAGERRGHEKNEVVAATAENHFIKGYRLPGEIVNAAPLDRMERAYQAARAYSDSSGVAIYNATRGGALEEFTRVDLDDVIDRHED